MKFTLNEKFTLSEKYTPDERLYLFEKTIQDHANGIFNILRYRKRVKDYAENFKKLNKETVLNKINELDTQLKAIPDVNDKTTRLNQLIREITNTLNILRPNWKSNFPDVGKQLENNDGITIEILKQLVNKILTVPNYDKIVEEFEKTDKAFDAVEKKEKEWKTYRGDDRKNPKKFGSINEPGSLIWQSNQVEPLKNDMTHLENAMKQGKYDELEKINKSFQEHLNYSPNNAETPENPAPENEWYKRFKAAQSDEERRGLWDEYLKEVWNTDEKSGPLQHVRGLVIKMVSNNGFTETSNAGIKYTNTLINDLKLGPDKLTNETYGVVLGRSELKGFENYRSIFTKEELRAPKNETLITSEAFFNLDGVDVLTYADLWKDAKLNARMDAAKLMETFFNGTKLNSVTHITNKIEEAQAGQPKHYDTEKGKSELVRLFNNDVNRAKDVFKQILFMLAPNGDDYNKLIQGVLKPGEKIQITMDLNLNSKLKALAINSKQDQFNALNDIKNWITNKDKEDKGKT